jgi:ABC-2 type transport system ATP-binding protein
LDVISCKELTKVYRRFEKEEGFRGSLKSLFHRELIEKRAVDGIDLAVSAGEFVGLIGPNGAGKTTLTKLMTGIVRKSSGALRVLGFDPNRLQNEFKMQYAVVMGQKSQLFFELTAADSLLLLKEMYRIPADTYRKNVRYFAELFSVEGLLNMQVRTLSLGERMKMELIAALLHNPRVLFLDEPTIGLDAVAQKQMRAFLREVNRVYGTTILLTSHYMEDIRSLCGRCVVMGRGKKLYDGGMEALFARYQTHRKLTVTFAEPGEHATPPGCALLEQTPNRLTLLVDIARARDAMRDILSERDVTDVRIEEEDIGTVVERIYGG